MADLKAQLEITADASGVEAGVGKAKRSLSDLGATAVKSGKDAAGGLEEIGKGGERSSQKIDSAARGIIGSIQRTAAVMEAGSRSSSKYFEALAAQRGVDVAVLRPYLDQLDQVAAKQKVAEQGLKGVGVSAGQTANALRMVPAQLTDIVTSLASGQAPLTVLIQQGGQLKDAFGGIGPAARALGGYVASLVNPFSLAAAGAAALAVAYHQGRQEANEYAKALILTGNAAGTTVDQLQDMASRIDAIAGTQSAAAAALAQFAASGDISGKSLERFTEIALRMEKETGQAVSETVKQFAELGKSPVEASIKLNEATRFLTAEIYSQIKALEDQGRTADAAALAQKAYADTLDSRLSQVSGRLGLVERAWRSVTSVAKEAWDAMLDVGRANTSSEQVNKLSKDIAAAQERIEKLGKLGAGRDNQRAITSEKARLESLQQQQSVLQENARLENRSAEAQKAAADRAKARIAFDKSGEQYLSKQAQMEREIAKARKEGAAAGASQADVEQRIADIRDKYKDKAVVRAGIQVDKSKLASDVDAIRNANEALAGSYANAEKLMEARRSAGLIDDREYYDSKRSFINLDAAAKEDALKKEIARYEQEKLTGASKIENDKKIAEATSKLVILRADSAAKLEGISLQEEGAAKRLQLSFLSAQQAAQDYFETIQKQQQRSLDGIGQGNQKRNYDSGVSQIEDRYAGQRRDLENQKAQLELEGKFTDDAKKQYERRLELIAEFQTKSIESYGAYYADLMRKQGSWELGAQEAFRNYADYASNAFLQTADLVSNAFNGMEDALANFVKTGKLDFKSLADSIISDLIRMQVRAAISSAAGGGSGVGGLVGMFASMFGGGSAGPSSTVNGVSWTSGFDVAGGRAIGGPVSAGSMYEVNEKGRPELLKVAGKQYLMMGSQPGSVAPAGGSGGSASSGAGGSAPPTLVIHNYSSERATAKEVVDSRGNRSWVAIVGDAVSAEVGRHGSSANNSARRSFGLQPALVQR